MESDPKKLYLAMGRGPHSTYHSSQKSTYLQKGVFLRKGTHFCITFDFGGIRIGIDKPFSEKGSQKLPKTEINNFWDTKIDKGRLQGGVE